MKKEKLSYDDMMDPDTPNWLWLATSKYKENLIINASCFHCFVDLCIPYNKIKKDYSETRERHNLKINKKSVSFTCPCHGGKIVNVSKKELQEQKKRVEKI